MYVNHKVLRFLHSRNIMGGGAVVYWIEPLTLDQRVAGSIPVNAGHFLSFSKTLYPHPGV